MPSLSSVSSAPAEPSALYCPLCDRYFLDETSCAVHIQHSSNHPQCEPCGLRFANGHYRRQHWCDSPRHHYCVACELEFQTAAGLRVHIEFAAVHRDDDDDDDTDDENDAVVGDSPGWEDALGRRMYPDDVDQPADDDFDIVERPFVMPTPEELWEMDMNDDDDDDDDDESDDELDFDEECEYDFSRRPTAGMRVTASSEPNVTSTMVVTGTMSSQAYAAAKEAQDALARAAELEAAQADEAPSGIRCHCPLCLETPEEPSATRCGHVFCTSCIRSALDVKRSCPVCRTPAVPLQLRKLFLSTN